MGDPSGYHWMGERRLKKVDVGVIAPPGSALTIDWGPVMNELLGIIRHQAEPRHGRLLVYQDIDDLGNSSLYFSEGALIALIEAGRGGLMMREWVAPEELPNACVCLLDETRV